jgi:hypothetical protein
LSWFSPSMKKITVVFLFVLWLPIPSFAWGPEGHRIVSDLARAHLQEPARRRIRELIGTDDLASISTWADEVRSQRPETYGWHFVDIPMNATGFLEDRDCYRVDDKHPEANQDHHNCVVDRIEIFERVLADRNASTTDRVEALKFLVHFVGDIHQPLHAMGEARGGNDISVVEFGSAECGTRPCNLHSAWDVGLIDHARRSEHDYVMYLENAISRANLAAQADGTPEEWANESFHLAHQVWLNPNGQVDEAYFKKHIGIVDKRLSLAGLRLARLLNESLGRESRKPIHQAAMHCAAQAANN